MSSSTKYSESSGRSKKLLKDTLSFIGIHRLSANPVNYTVCYEYLLGKKPLLKKVIDERISNNIHLTDEMMEQWYETFISGSVQAIFRESQDNLIELISKVTETANLAEENVDQYNQQLSHNEKELSDSSASLDSIVSQLIFNTKNMQASMELMKQQIQASKEEINNLQERLERASETVISNTPNSGDSDLI